MNKPEPTKVPSLIVHRFGLAEERYREIRELTESIAPGLPEEVNRQVAVALNNLWVALREAEGAAPPVKRRKALVEKEKAADEAVIATFSV